MSTKPILRCAIYTRKSSEEGLEQEFNSLHAQREACTAYIASQKHEGWQAIKTHYDDGGFSGGNMERPALKQLLEDIAAGKVDIIVVYKVDRLSRSLHDFARMVEVFDKHNVSFVSVTQQFNTTTSMGRLTLNVLLSFAQFEREVTGERIRDKIAASKQKGMWMGGFVPLGYDLKDRKLLINAKEAKTVRHIYQRYLELGCVRLLQEELAGQGVRSKARESGDRPGGAIISRGALYKILSNPIYIGQIRHKDVSHAGQHEPIIDQALWEQVRHHMTNNAVEHKTRSRGTSPLIGKLFDTSGERLMPNHANVRGRRYRYYVSQNLVNGANGSAASNWRLPAREIEQTIVRAAQDILNDRGAVTTALQAAGIAAHHIPAALKVAGEMCDVDAIIQLVERAELKPDGIRITLSLASLVPAGTNITITRDIPMLMKRRGVEMRLVIESNGAVAKVDPSLVKAVARAHAFFNDIASGKIASITEVASRAGMGDSYARSLLPLAFLAPDIVEAIIVAKQPADLTSHALVKQVDLPLDWAEQRRVLGFR